jgi:hypothetical protein
MLVVLALVDIGFWVIIGSADIKVQTLLLCGQKWGLQGLGLFLPISRYMGGHLHRYNPT